MLTFRFQVLSSFPITVIFYQPILLLFSFDKVNNQLILYYCLQYFNRKQLIKFNFSNVANRMSALDFFANAFYWLLYHTFPNILTFEHLFFEAFKLAIHHY